MRNVIFRERRDNVNSRATSKASATKASATKAIFELCEIENKMAAV